MFESFKKELKARCKRDDINENFCRDADNLNESTMNEFKKRSAELIIEGSGWGEHVLHHNSELAAQLKDLT